MEAERELNLPENEPVEVEVEPSQEGQVEVSKENRLRNTIEAGISRIQAKAEGVAQGIEQVAGTIPEKAGELKEKLGRAVARSLEVMKTMSLMAAVTLGPEFIRERPGAIEKITGPDGQIVYRHSDRETTIALDYITGKKDLPRDRKLELLKGAMKSETQGGFVFPEGFDQFNEDQVKSFVIETVRSNKGDRMLRGMLQRITLSEKKGADWLDRHMTGSRKFDQKYYEAIWQIEGEVGSPRIRFRDTFSKLLPKIGGMYSPEANIIYIDPEELTLLGGSDSPEGIFIAEASHAKQTSKKGKYNFEFEGIRRQIGVLFTSIVERKDPRTVYQRLYSTSGNVEYEAHKVIEPKLRDKIKKAKQKDK